MAEAKKIKLKIKSGSGEKKSKKPRADSTAAARALIDQLYLDPTPEREDGLDRIYPKEELEGYDEFMKRFDINDPLVGIREFHKRYGDIVNNSTRREILKTLQDGEKTFDEILETTGLDEAELKHQIVMLDFCVDELKRDDKTYYKLSKIGSIIKKFD
ncbi:MAG: ArsR family transcriptional regulator [Candidatus Syntrophoarchaeum sp.]|nr:ArsR family transcriptional regulator [Candidatus Syntrophoarchaeum sp.]